MCVGDLAGLREAGEVVQQLRGVVSARRRARPPTDTVQVKNTVDTKLNTM